VLLRASDVFLIPEAAPIRAPDSAPATAPATARRKAPPVFLPARAAVSTTVSRAAFLDPVFLFTICYF
jgi:hypothetical protein